MPPSPPDSRSSSTASTPSFAGASSCDSASDDHDSPWKEALETYFPQALALMAPELHALIDWTVPVQFLDKELQAVALPDGGAGRGRRHVDQLARVSRLGGATAWVLVHIEVQGRVLGSRARHQFARRMFDYRCRLWARHASRTSSGSGSGPSPDSGSSANANARLNAGTSVGIAADTQTGPGLGRSDDGPPAFYHLGILVRGRPGASAGPVPGSRLEPSPGPATAAKAESKAETGTRRGVGLGWGADYLEYVDTFLGHGVRFTFPVIYLSNWLDRWDELRTLAHTNPFAVVVMAQLQAIRYRDKYRRLDLKIQMARDLEHYGYSHDQIRSLLRFIDWMIRLPASLEPVFDQAMKALAREKTMTYVTTFERMGIRKGREQGLAEGQASLLLRQIGRRFGDVSEDTIQRVRQASVEQIELWSLNILDAKVLEDVFCD